MRSDKRNGRPYPPAEPDEYTPRLRFALRTPLSFLDRRFLEMVLIAQISDLHLRPRGVPAYRVSETNMLTERAIEALLALSPRPDAVIVTGDIVDGGLEVEYRLARELLGRLPMPVYPLAGNHDDPATMKRVFAGSPWANEGPADRVFYAADIGPLRLVALDSSVPGSGHGHLSDPQLAFLDHELGAAAGRPALVAVHHPPFRGGLPNMDRLCLRNHDALAAVIAGHGNVLRVLSGHVHRSMVTAFAGTVAMTVPAVTHQVSLALDDPSRFGLTFEPPAYCLHRWTEADGLTSHLAYVERFPGPFPFYPEKGFGWPHRMDG